MLKSIVSSVIYAGIWAISAELLSQNSASAQNLNIPAASICGTWKSVPHSGDYIHGENENLQKKVEGKVTGTYLYTIHTHGTRTLRATQTVSFVTPLDNNLKLLSGGRTRNITVSQTLNGVIQGNSIYFVDANQPFAEKWLQLPGNKFDVIGLRSGKTHGSINFIVEQTSRATCK